MTINERDFRGVDLNLLVSFLVLMRERSVSRAAQKMFLGQPAVSGALARLRQIFGDELFVRTATGMVPTARAHALAQALEPALQTVHAAIQSPAFNPGAAERVMRLGMPDWIEAWLMPSLLPHLRGAAPGLRVAVKSTDRRRAAQMLEQDEMDLGISVFTRGPAWQRIAELVSMNYSCVYHPRHIPLTRAPTLAQYLKYPHLFISYQGDFEGLVDAQLAQAGKARKVIYSTPHFATLPFLLASLPAFATVPQPLALHWQRDFGLRATPVPLKLAGFSVSLTWHARHDTDGALQWLRACVEKSVQTAHTAPANP